LELRSSARRYAGMMRSWEQSGAQAVSDPE
jgi:hypothetical protein